MLGPFSLLGLEPNWWRHLLSLKLPKHRAIKAALTRLRAQPVCLLRDNDPSRNDIRLEQSAPLLLSERPREFRRIIAAGPVIQRVVRLCKVWIKHFDLKETRARLIT